MLFLLYAPLSLVLLNLATSKELIRKTERIQRRATKYILNLPFFCEESYKDRLIKLDLLTKL